MKTNQPEIKQGNVTQQDIARARGGKLFHIEGLRGSFLDARFNDDCKTEVPVSAATEKALREQFGDSVKEVKVQQPKSKTDDGKGASDGDGDGDSAGTGSPEGDNK